MEMQSYDTAQSSNIPAQLGVASGNVYLLEIPSIAQHRPIPLSTVFTSSNRAVVRQWTRK